jgi:hypothetical protein
MAEQADLFEMAKAGQLRRNDLVWNGETGTRWVPAQTIEGLFARPLPPPIAAEADAPGDVAGAAGLPRPSWLPVGLWALIAALLAVLTIRLLMR